MQPPAGIAPLAPGEILYRRVPGHWYSPSAGLTLESFLPSSDDDDGLSLWRQSVSPEWVASSGREGKSYFVAEIIADSVTALGLTVVPDQPDHVFIPELTYVRRRSADMSERSFIKQRAEDLRAACDTVHGPFPGTTVKG
jgi:hypothetical protein